MWSASNNICCIWEFPFGRVVVEVSIDSSFGYWCGPTHCAKNGFRILSIVCQRLIVIILVQKVSSNVYQTSLTPLTQVPKFLLESISTSSELFICGVYMKRFSETNVVHSRKHGNASLVFVILKFVLHITQFFAINCLIVECRLIQCFDFLVKHTLIHLCHWEFGH